MGGGKKKKKTRLLASVKKWGEDCAAVSNKFDRGVQAYKDAVMLGENPEESMEQFKTFVKEFNE